MLTLIFFDTTLPENIPVEADVNMFEDGLKFVVNLWVIFFQLFFIHFLSFELSRFLLEECSYFRDLLDIS